MPASAEPDLTRLLVHEQCVVQLALARGDQHARRKARFRANLVTITGKIIAKL